MTSPASPPTSVPLMRMNCRSRPRSSSSLFDVSSGSHRETVLLTSPAISSLISATIARWDAEETSDKLELLLGRDLQFIRINGTVVGGLAGVVIHAAADVLR